jgi:hypothetical protein
VQRPEVGQLAGETIDELECAFGITGHGHRDRAIEAHHR